MLADRFFRLLCLGSGLLVLAVLGLIVITTTWQAMPALRAAGLRFLTSDVWNPNDPDGTPEFGALAFLFGTAVVSLVAVVVAVPIAIGIALFLTELAPRRLRGPVITALDLLAAIPSVVFGLLGVLVLAPALAPVYQKIHTLVAAVPVLNRVLDEPTGNGRGFLTAGLILALMIIPIITSISREVFSTVPQADRHAALALGATRWEMIKGAVLPHSFGGVVGAIMLGLGRAMGETIAVALTIGSATQIVPNLFAPGDAMPAVIVLQFGESSGLHTSALIGLAVVLFALTVLVNLLARVIVRGSETRMRGA